MFTPNVISSEFYIFITFSYLKLLKSIIIFISVKCVWSPLNRPIMSSNNERFEGDQIKPILIKNVNFINILLEKNRRKYYDT